MKRKNSKKVEKNSEAAGEMLSAEAAVWKPNLVQTDIRIIGDSRAIS